MRDDVLLDDREWVLVGLFNSGMLRLVCRSEIEAIGLVVALGDEDEMRELTLTGLFITTLPRLFSFSKREAREDSGLAVSLGDAVVAFTADFCVDCEGGDRVESDGDAMVSILAIAEAFSEPWGEDKTFTISLRTVDDPLRSLLPSELPVVMPRSEATVRE